MRRIVGSWPYVAVVALGYAMLWALLLGWAGCSDAEAAGGGTCPISSIEFKSVVVTFLYAVVPVTTFATGAVLGFRRGYDVVAVAVCLAVWLAIPEPLPQQDGGLSLYWGNKVWFPVVAIAVIGHFGILVGIGIRRFTARRSRA